VFSRSVSTRQMRFQRSPSRAVHIGPPTIDETNMARRNHLVGSGDLFVCRIGDGSAALGSTGTAVFIDEYTTAGALVQTIPMPTAASEVHLVVEHPEPDLDAVRPSAAPTDGGEIAALVRGVSGQQRGPRTRCHRPGW
jgi:hypothetical protein